MDVSGKRSLLIMVGIVVVAAGCGGETSPSFDRDGAAASTTTSLPSPATPTTEIVLTNTEFDVVGTWKAVAIEDPKWASIVEQVGDNCTMRSDLTMSCTIESKVLHGYWRANDEIAHGRNPMRATLDWIFDVSGSRGGSTSVEIDGNTMLVGGRDVTTFALTERLPATEPTHAWTDEATQQLIGTWTLASHAEDPRIIHKIAGVGDTCTFTADHLFECVGSVNGTGIWRTSRPWPAGSPQEGASSVRIESDDGASTRTHYSFEDDRLRLSMDDAEWDRVSPGD